MPFLTYRADRRLWTEHENFPKGALKYKQDVDEGRIKAGWGYTNDMDIYYLTEDRRSVLLIDPEDYKDWM